MRRQTVPVLALVAALLTFPALADVTVTLEFTPAQVLPGVPPTYVLRVTNSGRADVHLGPTYRFYTYDDHGARQRDHCS